MSESQGCGATPRDFPPGRHHWFMTVAALPSIDHELDQPLRRIPLTPLVTVARPVTSLGQAARVAMDRTRRFTLLGELPVLGTAVIPWLWPLHLGIVGWTADHIRHTPDASLSYCDGLSPRPHRPATALAVAVGAGWLSSLCALVLALESLRLETAALAVMLAAVLPALIELVGLIEFALLNPEWVMLKRERARRNDGRTTYVLTSLVSRVDGQGYAGRLIRDTYPQWQAADAVVIGYPASRSLVSYYIRLGARRERPHGPHLRPPRRRVTFDCRQPLRGPVG